MIFKGWAKEGEPTEYERTGDGVVLYKQHYRCTVCGETEFWTAKTPDVPVPEMDCDSCRWRFEEERKAWSCYFRSTLEAGLRCSASLAMADEDGWFEGMASIADKALEKYKERFPWPPKK